MRNFVVLFYSRREERESIGRNVAEVEFGTACFNFVARGRGKGEQLEGTSWGVRFVILAFTMQHVNYMYLGSFF